jgi:signal transduction histidine kinase
VLRQPDAPRLAILDWVMPGMDGAEVCRRLRALKREEPTYIILLTAKGGKENIIAGLESGADDYISKPFDREELHARLQVGLRIVNLQSSLAARVRELEQALSGAQKMEAVGRLAGGVAHDFNNLLTIILASSDLLLEDELSERQRDAIHMIKQSGERGAALTRQLLAFSRKQVLRPVVVGLNSLVANIEKMLRRLIGEDIELTVHQGADLYPVLADVGQLEQVLMNLVVNARDAMSGGGRIVIETRNAQLSDRDVAGRWPAQPGPHAVLVVRDTGCGMDEETRRHLFEPFFTTKEPGKGTGLGLATVYGIIRQSNGHIEVDSSPGQGSELRIYLPRTTQVPEEVRRSSTAGRPERGAEVVLVVEDEDGVRALTRQILQAHSYTVLEACDGEDALRVSAGYPSPIHLLLTDVVMPHLGGPQLADRLLLERPTLKVLYMSGYPDASIPSRCGADLEHHFLQKPFSPTALTRKVREVLDR